MVTGTVKDITKYDEFLDFVVDKLKGAEQNENQN